MRTETIKIYTYAELSEKAKEKALNDWQINNDNPYNYENWQAVREIEKAFDISFKDRGYCEIDLAFSFDDNWQDGAGDLAGGRAYAFLEPIITRICAGGYSIYTKEGEKAYYESKYYKGKFRYSKIAYEYNTCPLTGYCLCCNIWEAWEDWKNAARVNKYISVSDYFDILSDRLSKEINADNDWYYSAEGLEEYAENNDWEYLESGERY